ncbi:MAG: hypothetical protein HY741_23580 [Chloroflexi bacterium]|nr:hypothetical protein [Chloroflexota bacterium]
MKRYLNLFLSVKVSHPVVLATLLLALLTSATAGVVWAQGQSGRGPESSNAVIAAPPGKMRVSAISYTSSVSIPGDSAWLNIANLNVIVPTGKVAELTVVTNAEAYTSGGSNGWCYGQYRLDNATSGTILQPGEMWLIDRSVYLGKYPTITMQGFAASSLGAGVHTVYFNMRCTSGTTLIYDTSMIVNYNVHRP